MNTFRFSNSNMTLMHFLTLNFQSLRILIFENQASTPDIEEKHDNASKQVKDIDVYEEVQNDPSILINTIMCASEKI